jgi:hypothetical protein
MKSVRGVGRTHVTWDMQVGSNMVNAAHLKCVKKTKRLRNRETTYVSPVEAVAAAVAAPQHMPV